MTTPAFDICAAVRFPTAGPVPTGATARSVEQDPGPSSKVAPISVPMTAIPPKASTPAAARARRRDQTPPHPASPAAGIGGRAGQAASPAVSAAGR